MTRDERRDTATAALRGILGYEGPYDTPRNRARQADLAIEYADEMLRQLDAEREPAGDDVTADDLRADRDSWRRVVKLMTEERDAIHAKLDAIHAALRDAGFGDDLDCGREPSDCISALHAQADQRNELRDRLNSIAAELDEEALDMARRDEQGGA